MSVNAILTGQGKSRYPNQPITKAAYDQLSDEDKAKDIIYVITDDETDAIFQPLISASGVLVGDGSGGITSKTLDTASLTDDNNHIPTSGVVKSALNNARALTFTVTLVASSWSNNAQTVSSSYFVASGYAYTVCPSASNFMDYASAQIYADDVTTDGSMAFHCDSVPSSDLTVNIMRTEVSA